MRTKTGARIIQPEASDKKYMESQVISCDTWAKTGELQSMNRQRFVCLQSMTHLDST